MPANLRRHDQSARDALAGVVERKLASVPPIPSKITVGDAFRAEDERDRRRRGIASRAARCWGEGNLLSKAWLAIFVVYTTAVGALVVGLGIDALTS